MKIEALFPRILLKVEFTFNKVKFIPSAFGCYVLTTFDGEILYIGQSNNLTRRIRQHLENINKTTVTEAGRAFFCYYKIVEKETELNKLERGWINQYELTEGQIPILNSVRAPI